MHNKSFLKMGAGVYIENVPECPSKRNSTPEYSAERKGIALTI